MSVWNGGSFNADRFRLIITLTWASFFLMDESDTFRRHTHNSTFNCLVSFFSSLRLAHYLARQPNQTNIYQLEDASHARLLSLSSTGQRTTLPRPPRIIPRAKYTLLTNRAVSAAAGGLHNNPLAGLHLGRILRAHTNLSFFPVILLLLRRRGRRRRSLLFRNPAHPDILPALRFLTPLQAVRMIHPSLREDRHLDGNAKLNVANHAIPTTMLALPTGAGTQTEIPQQHGVAALENFGVRDARVSHVCVHARGTLPIGPCAASAGDGLVVAKALGCFCFVGKVAAVSKGEIVGVALRGSASLETSENDVGYSLALFIYSVSN